MSDSTHSWLAEYFDREIYPYEEDTAVDQEIKRNIDYIASVTSKYLMDIAHMPQDPRHQPSMERPTPIQRKLLEIMRDRGGGALQDSIVREVLSKDLEKIDRIVDLEMAKLYKKRKYIQRSGEVRGLIKQNALGEIVRLAAGRVARGKVTKPPSPLDDIRGATALDIFENQYVEEDSALMRVLKANIGPATAADLDDVERMYEEIRWKEGDALSFMLGNWEHLKDRINSEGIFLAPFVKYEKEAMLKLFEAEKRAKQFDREEQPGEYFAEEIPVSCVLRDKFTNELLAMSVYTVPPINAKKNNEYRENMEETLSKWPQDKQREMRKKFEAGKVGMLFLVMGKVHCAPALSMYLTIQQMINIRPDLEYVWSFYLHDLKMGLMEIFKDDTIAYLDPPEPSPDPLSNTRSARLLTDYGFKPEGVFSSVEEDGQNPQRTTFVLKGKDPELNFRIHRKVGLDASWRLVIATVSDLIQRSENRMRGLLKANEINPAELDAARAQLEKNS